jgi:hypothetical protein
MPVVSSQKHLFEKPFHYTQLGMVSWKNAYPAMRNCTRGWDLSMNSAP